MRYEPPGHAAAPPLCPSLSCPQALEGLLPPGPVWRMLAETAEGQALAAALVGRHWVPGVALGSAALQARTAAGLDLQASDGASLQLQQGG
jgi:hypothetical protein